MLSLKQTEKQNIYIPVQWTAARDAQIARINDLQDYIKNQRVDLADFDEALVKRWLKQITVWEDHFTVELKSELKIDIEG